MRDRLKWSILALAQPADVQLSLFPDFTCKADELALNFEDGLYEMLGHEEEFSPAQLSAIKTLDDLIVAMSGKENSAFWTDDAVRSHVTWQEVRRLAILVIDAFGWEFRPPPPSDAVYIPAGPSEPN